MYGWICGNAPPNKQICFDGNCTTSGSDGFYYIYKRYGTYTITLQGSSNPVPSQVVHDAPITLCNIACGD